MAAWLVLILLGSPESPSGQERYFKEDHLTGAEYLRLTATGTYEVVLREHMGIWAADFGRWSEKNGEWLFVSAKTKDATFRCRLVRSSGRTFLVWRGKAPPGIEFPADEAREDLGKDSRSTPPYVFFEVDRKTFDRESRLPYPFKYYPEMNRSR